VAKNIAQQREQDKETVQIIDEGASLAQLSRIFRKKPENIKARIIKVTPSGKRLQHPVWRIADVAPYLVTPAYSQEEFVRIMSAEDLPPALRSEYWSAMNQQRKFLLDGGDLLPASMVQGMIATILQDMRVALTLTKDNISRKFPGTTVEQRNAIDTGIRNIQEDFSARLAAAFDKQQGTVEAAFAATDGGSLPQIDFAGEAEDPEEYAVPEDEDGDEELQFDLEGL